MASCFSHSSSSCCSQSWAQEHFYLFQDETKNFQNFVKTRPRASNFSSRRDQEVKILVKMRSRAWNLSGYNQNLSRYQKRNLKFMLFYVQVKKYACYKNDTFPRSLNWRLKNTKMKPGTFMNIWLCTLSMLSRILFTIEISSMWFVVR